MPSYLRLLPVLGAVLSAVLVLVTGCSQGQTPDGDGSSSTDADADGGGADVAAGTCWGDTTLGADPQDVLRLSKRFQVPYLVAARAVADRPAFDRRVGCGANHTVEVYKVVRLPKLAKQLADYAALLRIQSELYGTVSRTVSKACMTGQLASAVERAGVPNAVMQPMLPRGASIGWAPAAPDRWMAGRRVFACTLTWTKPQPLRYADVFTKRFPTGKRTCIESRSLVFVDCARRHDRERIAVIDVRDAVGSGAFPGTKAIRRGPDGSSVELGDDRWQKLDAACTAYLRSVSTTKKLSGVANIDADEWPAADGSYPVYCEADTPTTRDSLVTEGSVYDR